MNQDERQVIDIALSMARARHISQHDAIVKVGYWLWRAAYRLRHDLDIYTGKRKRDGD